MGVWEGFRGSGQNPEGTSQKVFKFTNCQDCSFASLWDLCLGHELVPALGERCTGHREDPLGFSWGQTSPCPAGHSTSQNIWQRFSGTYRHLVAEGAGCPHRWGVPRKLSWMLVLTPWETVIKVWSASETLSVPSGCLSRAGLQPQDYLGVQFTGRDQFRNKRASNHLFELKSKSFHIKPLKLK